MKVPSLGRDSARLYTRRDFDMSQLRNVPTWIFAALRAWFRRTAWPPNVPPGLRRDLGLPPEDQPKHWTDFR